MGRNENGHGTRPAGEAPTVEAEGRGSTAEGAAQLALFDLGEVLPATAANRPKRMISGANSDLRRTGIYTFTIPALTARLHDGSLIMTCPSAGVCAKACYATRGTYRFSNVRAAHIRNLTFIIEDPAGWEAAMNAELAHRRYAGKWLRVHDAGDYFADWYLEAWLRIARANPRTTLYSYTKEVGLFKALVEPNPPDNFLWTYSLGGRDDHLVNRQIDRYTDVFPTEEAIADAGHYSQVADDRHAVTGPNPGGMAANNIPQFLKRQGNRTFGEWQAEEQGSRAPRRRRSSRER